MIYSESICWCNSISTKYVVSFMDFYWHLQQLSLFKSGGKGNKMMDTFGMYVKWFFGNGNDSDACTTCSDVLVSTFHNYI